MNTLTLFSSILTTWLLWISAAAFAEPGGMKFVVVPAGEFVMGSPPEETSDHNNARDRKEFRRRVILTRSFKMATKEVNRGVWRAIMGEIPGSRIDTTNPLLPASDMTWEQAAEFINRVNLYENSSIVCGNQLTNEGRETARQTPDCYRMPTEAEWEYAARSGTSTAFNIGAKFSPKVVNCGQSSQSKYMEERNTGNGAVVVSGSLENANSWGIYDMHGNVAEMVADYYLSDWSMEDPATDPIGPDWFLAWTVIDGIQYGKHIVRGGNAGSEAYKCRSAARSTSTPNYPVFKGGVRLVRTCAPDGCH